MMSSKRSGTSEPKYQPVNANASVPSHVQGLLVVSVFLLIVSTGMLAVNLYIASEVRQEYNDLDVSTTVPMVQQILTRVQDLLKDPERAESVFSAIKEADLFMKKAQAENLIAIMAHFMSTMAGQPAK